jgi:hypothetical protein
MTKDEIRLQSKLTALNKIRKLYNPKYISKVFEHKRFNTEERELMINDIIEKLEKELSSGSIDRNKNIN